jgi:hypothetical protein
VADDFLGMIPAYGPDGKRLDLDDGQWTLSSKPVPSEIDYPKTSDDLLFEDRAVLKDGRRITWHK